MIPIQFSDEKAEKYYEQFVKDKKNDIEVALKELDLPSDLTDYWDNDIEKLIKLKPNELVEAAKKWKSTYKKDIEFKDLYEFIFGKNETKYRLFTFWQIDTCAYCNRSFIFSLEVDNTDNKKIQGTKGIKSVKGEIDHFFSKSKYPIFAITYANLIPACHQCNFIKGDADPLDENGNLVIPYPYILKADDVKFTVSIQKIGQLNFKSFHNKDAAKKMYEIKIINKDNSNYEDIFHLLDIYNEHLDYIDEIIKKSVFYTDGYVKKQLLPLLQKHFHNLSEQELYRLIFGTFPTKEEFHRRPLSKFTYDILKQLGII